MAIKTSRMNSHDKLRVLLIEDDEEDYDFIRTLLSDSSPYGVRLDWANSYESGLAALSQISYDACLLDFALGDRTGIELLSEAREKGASAAVIFITGHEGDGIDLKALNVGATDYLVKGEINARTLQRSIRYAVERNKAKLELKRYKDHLEDLIKQRTSELQETNLRLRRQIDERLGVEQALRQSEEKYRFLVNSSLDIIYTIGPRGIITSLNPAFRRVTGWQPEEWVGRKYVSLIHPDDLPIVLERRQKAESGADLPPAETRVLVKSGGFRVIEFQSVPIYAGNSIVGTIGTARDITNRKKAEEKLRRARDDLEMRVQKRTAELADANLALINEIIERSRIEEALRLNEKRLEALLNLSQTQWTSDREIADYVLDQEMKLTRSEAGAVGFLDKEEKVLTWCSAVPGQIEGPEIQTGEAGTWADAVRNRGPVVQNDVSIAQADQKGLPFPHIYLRRFASVPLLDGERVAAVTVVANKNEYYEQSDLRQLALLMDGMWKLIQRERSMKALKEAENLAAIGRALSSVAHDMKTPLVAIGGFARQVQRHIEESDPDWAKIGIVLCETERLEKLVEDMLDFSKPLQLQKSHEEIDAILQESVAVIKHLAEEKKLELRVEALEFAPPFLLDRLRIKRAFINLLTNAVEASPEGQTVTICYHMLGNDLVVDFTDSGPGIAFEIRNEIFLPFFTTRSEGTGLGLPIVKKIVEAHEGSLEVLDTPRGTTFRLRLPGHCQGNESA